MYRHQILSPFCAVVASPLNSENVPIINCNYAAPSLEMQQQLQTAIEQTSTSDQSQTDMKLEVNRLATFKNWPVSIQASFYTQIYEENTFSCFRIQIYPHNHWQKQVFIT